MSLNPSPLYAAPDDWRAYSGVLSRRIFAFIVDYVIVALLCIPAAVVLFFVSILTFGLGFFLYPALFIIAVALAALTPRQSTSRIRHGSDQR